VSGGARRPPGVGGHDVPTPLTVLLQADTKDLEAGLSKASGGFEVFGQKVSGGMLAAGAGIAGAAVIAVGAIADWTNAAAEDRAEQEKLIATYGRLGVSTDTATAAIDAAIAMGAEKAVSDSEVRAAMESLITATGDAAAANAALGPTLDIAAAAGVSAEVAAAAYSKALAGNDSALRKLFPGMTKQATAADTITEATRLSEGAADDYAKSAEGMGKKGGQAFDELTETIGAVFLPIMDEVVPALLPIIELLGELIKGLLPLLKPVIMVAVGGIKILIEILMKVIGFLNDVVAAVKGVIDWVGQMVDIAANAKGAVEGALDEITPWSVAGAQGIPAIAELGARALGAGPRSMLPAGGGTSVTVQVMSADPEQVVRAIRRWSRSNGGSGPFTRGLDRSTA
jgi:hypothetical protein